MIESQILKVLQTGVIAAVAASVTPALAVKYVGLAFTPPADAAPWLEVVYIPNNNENEFWGSGKTYRGLMRLLVHWPVDNEGAYGPMELAQSIAGYFNKGRQFTTTGGKTVTITDEPNMLGVLESAPDLLVPISVRYSCFDAP